MVNVPFGGTKGGVVCDPKQLTRNDLRKVTRRYIAELEDCIGPNTDILAPDVGTDAETMAWVYGTYAMMHPRRDNLPVVTGKPLDLGGVPGRREATALGCLFVTNRALERGILPGRESLKDATVIIQGFGNAGSIAAQLFVLAAFTAFGPASGRVEPAREMGGQLPPADLRTAAYVLALDRVARTATERGVWP